MVRLLMPKADRSGEGMAVAVICTILMDPGFVDGSAMTLPSESRYVNLKSLIFIAACSHCPDALYTLSTLSGGDCTVPSVWTFNLYAVSPSVELQ
jgi:hypothetical protein